jgi:hypothetical protein
MSFKNFLKEFYNIETSQAFKAHEPDDSQSSSILNNEVISKINVQLSTELNERTLSPQTGIQKIRKVLHSFALDFPVSYDIDSEGDEVVFETNQFGKAYGPTPTSTDMTHEEDDVAYVYVLYYLTDEGYYEFYAEVSKEYSRMEELLNDGLEDEDENEE